VLCTRIDRALNDGPWLGVVVVVHPRRAASRGLHEVNPPCQIQEVSMDVQPGGGWGETHGNLSMGPLSGFSIVLDHVGLMRHCSDF